MSPSSLLMTSTAHDSPFDGSRGDGEAKISEFLTLQSLANFAAMTGAISIASRLLGGLFHDVPQLVITYVLAGAWGVASVWMSWDGLKVNGRRPRGAAFTACFLALLNSLVLAGAVIGTDVALASLGAAASGAAGASQAK